MINENNHYHFKHSNDFDQQRISRSSHCNWYRLLIVLILLILSVVTTTSLIVILYTDAMKEQALIEKRKTWIGKWEIIKPYVAKFPLGFLLSFIRNLIVLAIDKQAEVE